MAFSYLDNMPVDKARELFINALKESVPSLCEEKVKTVDADTRITSRGVYAKICAPHYHASAMDGIAVKASDTFEAGETTPVILDKESFQWVDTGDPLPEGADAVIMIEDVVREGESVKLFAPASPWQHIRQIGEDLCAGDMILPSFTEITPEAQGALLAGGVMEVDVIKKPVVAVIPTGDELVSPCENPKAGEIIEFNTTIFSSMLKRWGCIPKVFDIQPDVPEKITAALKDAVKDCDAVLLSAGSSAGRDDYSVKCISEVGKVLCHGVAMKPGKPVILAMAGKVPVMGVPGYPVSAVLALQEFFYPIANWLCGRKDKNFDFNDTATLCRPVVSSLKYSELVRTRLGFVEGRLAAAPLQRGAGVVSSLVKADGIIKIDQNSEGCDSGEDVPLRLLCEKDELKNTLVVTGSHDPLIDEIADMAKRIDRGARIASSHVGSTGGLLALKRHEAHMGGIHLLSDDGTYNINALKSFFGEDEVILVKGVGRIQGLMTAPGNPLNIKDFSDVLKGYRYVNRQGGSGTRILFDYLCKKHDISPQSVNGWNREEMTHTAVAAQIASGTGDLGLGIFSAAKLYSLDFIPVCTENYDFAVLKSAWELPQTQMFINILRSEEFKKRLEALGGYTAENAGEVLTWN